MAREGYNKHESIFTRGAASDVLYQDCNGECVGYTETKTNNSGSFRADAPGWSMNKKGAIINTGNINPLTDDATLEEIAYPRRAHGIIELDMVFAQGSNNVATWFEVTHGVVDGGIWRRHGFNLNFGSATITEMDSGGNLVAAACAKFGIAEGKPSRIVMRINTITDRVILFTVGGLNVALLNDDGYDDSNFYSGQHNIFGMKVTTKIDGEAKIQVGDIVISAM